MWTSSHFELFASFFLGFLVFSPTRIPLLPPRPPPPSQLTQNHLCVFGGMDAGGVIKEQDYFTSLLDAREGRWHKRAIAVDPNLSGDYHGAILVYYNGFLMDFCTRVSHVFMKNISALLMGPHYELRALSAPRLAK